MGGPCEAPDAGEGEVEALQPLGQRNLATPDAGACAGDDAVVRRTEGDAPAAVPVVGAAALREHEDHGVAADGGELVVGVGEGVGGAVEAEAAVGRGEAGAGGVVVAAPRDGAADDADVAGEDGDVEDDVGVGGRGGEGESRGGAGAGELEARARREGAEVGVGGVDDGEGVLDDGGVVARRSVREQSRRVDVVGGGRRWR